MLCKLRLAPRQSSALSTGCVQNETVINIANKHSKSPAQVLLAWGLQHGATVIPRATKLSQQKVRPDEEQVCVTLSWYVVRCLNCLEHPCNQ